MTDSEPRCWGMIPAAGIGRRMGHATPKQYLEIDGTTLLEYSLGVLLACDWIEKVAVALHPEDSWAEGRQCMRDQRVLPVRGGAERMDSVLAGLDALAGMAGPEDWVLVHDAARPCVRVQDVECLRERVITSGTGAILAEPLLDTVKRVDGELRVLETLDRSALWRAQTPQMFRLGLLRQAIRGARREGVITTDESAAMERAGHPVQLVPGSPGNIKVTLPEDLRLAEWQLRQRLDGSVVGEH